MMKLKNEEGVTLVALTLTVIVLIILGSITITSYTSQLGLKNVNNLYSDIDSISTKISAYYLENDSLPVFNEKYKDSKADFKTLIDNNGAKDNVINPNDGENYYVIDLSKLDNLTLNYGIQYKDWKDDADATKYQDLYVINEVTHQIYYPHGVKYKKNFYFTADKNIGSTAGVAKANINEGFSVQEITCNISKSTKKTSTSEKIVVSSDVTLALDNTQYVQETLTYAFAESKASDEEKKSLSYSKFTINDDHQTTLVSKALDRLTQKYYLYIKALDINGEEHYLEQEVDRLKNAEAGWVLADDLNTSNDWYQYMDTSGEGTIATVNAPILADGMEAVKYAGEDTMDASTIETLTSGSRWANAVTKDGSMWVWIPRYAYRITSGYHQSGADINPTTPTQGAGTIEIAFVDSQNHFLDKSLRGQTILTSGVTDETYTASNVWILAPGFEFGDEHLTGFWTAKFEASNAESVCQNTTDLTLQIKPNAKSWTKISAINAFTVCQELKSSSNYGKYFNSITNVDSHLMKNVEWGAIAYLAHSKYGLNGEEIYINNYTGYKTGISGTSPTVTGSSDMTNIYNTIPGINASTTKSVYGIYDMSGGANERVAGCYTGQTAKFTDSSDLIYISKYVDVYNGYNISKYGDAVYETSSSVSSGTSSWFKDQSYFMSGSYPVLNRGGNSFNQSGAGLFSFSNDGGNAGDNGSFRPTIAITDEASQDQIQNMPEGWVVASSNNTANDWYAYKDTSSVSGAVAEVNAPKLASGMTPIKYVGEEDTSDQDLATLTSGSKWANAMTKDGSMWVWIPRYAYRITSGYHQSGADINSEHPELGAGTIDIAFLDSENNFLDPNITGTVVTSGVTYLTYADTTKWILEPAFEFGDNSVDGFWFAKFEASNNYWYGADSATADRTSLTLQVKPNVTSWRSITSKNMFTVCQELISNTNYEKYFNNVINVDTHMTKNIEWGAVAYLAHSKYGLNGQEVYINNYSGLKTGISALSAIESASNSDVNKYDTTNGINASTSKNIYGIYDMSGGATENVAGCNLGQADELTSNTDLTYINKYIDRYSLYSNSKYGDAVYETSRLSINTNSWFNDTSDFVNLIFPIFNRGGDYQATSSAGLFYYNEGKDSAVNSVSFRPVCVVY